MIQSTEQFVKENEFENTVGKPAKEWLNREESRLPPHERVKVEKRFTQEGQVDISECKREHKSHRKYWSALGDKYDQIAWNNIGESDGGSE